MLVITIFSLNIFKKIIIETKQKTPPHKLKIKEETFPEKRAPNAIRKKSIIPASFFPSRYIAVRVIILERPILIPGIGTIGGICNSIIKIMSASAVRSASVVNRFIFKKSPISKLHQHQNFDQFQ